MKEYTNLHPPQKLAYPEAYRPPRPWDIEEKSFDVVYNILRPMIGTRYLDANWHQVSLKTELLTYLKEDYEKSKTRRGAFVFGLKGVGKSCVMALFAKYFMQKFKVNIRYFSAPELFNTLFDCSKMEVTGIATCDVLFVDDLNREISNQMTISRFNQIIETRYAHNYPTFISSNLNLDDLEKLNGYDAAVHRFRDKTFMIRASLMEQKRV